MITEKEHKEIVKLVKTFDRYEIRELLNGETMITADNNDFTSTFIKEFIKVVSKDTHFNIYKNHEGKVILLVY